MEEVIRLTWAAVVVYYRRGPAIWRTVESILVQKPAPREVVLVDNGSADGVLNPADAAMHGVRLIQLSQNLGYAGGMNAGISAVAPAERLLLATHDVLLPENAISSFTRTADADDSIVAVAPVLMVDGAVWSAGGSIGLRGPRHYTSVPDQPTQVSWVDGCCVLVRSTALVSVGGIDERYFLYWEDVDLGDRLSRKGRVVVDPAVRVNQETALTPVYYGARNAILYWRSRGRYGAALVATLRSTAKLLVRDSRHRESRRARYLGMRHGWTGELIMPPLLTRER